MTNWGTAIVIDLRVLDDLKGDVTRLGVSRKRLLVCASMLVAFVALLVPVLWKSQARVARLTEDNAALREQYQMASTALETMTQSHRKILAATEVAPTVGTKSWGRQFVVTQYIPRSPDYGKFNDGFTATMKKADPNARIVAVDPALIPYGSRVWIEGLGWFNAEDCGSAIKGFRLDVLAATTKDAMRYGKQKRFVIVVPPGTEGASAGTTAMLRSPSGDAGSDDTERRRAEERIG